MPPRTKLIELQHKVCVGKFVQNHKLKLQKDASSCTRGLLAQYMIDVMPSDNIKGGKILLYV